MRRGPELPQVVTLVFDAEHRLIAFSAGAADAFGLAADAHGTALETVAREVFETTLAADAAAVAGGRIARSRWVATADGRRWRLELHADRATPGGTGVIVNGVSPAAAAQGDGERLVDLLTRVELPAAVVDRDGIVAWAGDRLAARLGRDAAGLVGLAWCELCVPTPWRDTLRRRLAARTAAGAAGELARLPVPSGDGPSGAGVIAWFAAPCHDAAGTVSTVALIGVPVPAVERPAAAPRAQDPASAARLARAAHELDRGLETLGLLHGVLRRAVTDPVGRETVELLAGVLASLSSKVDRIAAVVRRQAPPPAPRPAPVPLAALLDGLRRRHPRTVRIVAGSAVVRTDRRLLTDALDAVVDDALDHACDGRVLVGCRRRGQDVALEVRAVRRGPLPILASEAAAGPEPAATRGEALAAALTALGRQPGHRIELRQVPGHQTTLALRLPRAVPAAIRTHRGEPAAVERPRLLVLVDDATERRAFAQLLELAGFAVIAPDDPEGVRTAPPAAAAPDLVVLDAGFAAGSAARALRRLRAALGAAVPAIVLGDDAELGAEPSIRRLARPVTGEALLAAIHDVAPPTATEAPGREAAAPSPLVAIIGAAREAREDLAERLQRAGYEVATFDGVDGFLAVGPADRIGCVLLDLDAESRDGLAKLVALAPLERAAPVVVLHAGDDVLVAVGAMRAGAFDFLETPVADSRLADTVRLAMRERWRRGRREEASVESRHRFDRLTPREREVLGLVLAGHANKAIAQRLGISPRTVENHRARLMEKAGVHSLAELVAQARSAGVAV